MAEKKPDVILLEVGIGGLYDSTNVITPVVSVITTVGWDHMKYLGDTLAKIAAQKAGIIKKGVPVVLGALPTEARETILADAKEKKSPVFELGKDFTVHKLNGHQFHAKIRYQGKLPIGILISFDSTLSNSSCIFTATSEIISLIGMIFDVIAVIFPLLSFIIVTKS